MQRNWLFGFGYNDWPRPHWLQFSVDSYWLNRAIMFGMPGFFVHILATASAIFIVARAKLPDSRPLLSEARKGWMFSVIATVDRRYHGGLLARHECVFLLYDGYGDCGLADSRGCRAGCADFAKVLCLGAVCLGSADSDDE